MHRSFNLSLLLEATECHRDKYPAKDFITWFRLPRSIMLAEGRNVGLATYECPGIYSVHWYYQDARGRDAIILGKKMLGEMFDKYGAEIIRAFIRVDLKASRWACRQLGFKSLGILTFADGEDNELFAITKKEFNMKENKNG